MCGARWATLLWNMPALPRHWACCLSHWNEQRPLKASWWSLCELQVHGCLCSPASPCTAADHEERSLAPTQQEVLLAVMCASPRSHVTSKVNKRVFSFIRQSPETNYSGITCLTSASWQGINVLASMNLELGKIKWIYELVNMWHWDAPNIFFNPVTESAGQA